MKFSNLIFSAVLSVSGLVGISSFVSAYQRPGNPSAPGYFQRNNPAAPGYIQNRNPAAPGYVQDKGVFGFL